MPQLTSTHPQVSSWHQQADTFDKMEAEVMERTWNLTTALIQKIDD